MKHLYIDAFLLLPVGLFAQSSTDDTATLVRELARRVVQLEKRVEDLEGQLREAKFGAPLPVARVSPQYPTAANGHDHGTPMSQEPHSAGAQEAATLQSSPLLKLAGFSDFNFSASTLTGSRSGFNEGQFTLHMTSALSPRVNVFGEFTFTARADGGMGSPAVPGFNPEVERILIRYDQSDFFKVSFGRYHTPINWWNNAYHHGQWLQTSVSRPEMTQFGGRFIPVHFVGAMVEGAAPAGGLNLNYNFGLGNGRGSVISRGGDAGDENNHRAWLMNFFVKPNRVYGLQAGASVYRDRIPMGGRSFGEWIQSAHVVWAKETPEFIAEFANVSHKEAGARNSTNSQAWYVQLGYRLPFDQQHWKPYYRFEYVHVPRADEVFRQVPGLAGSTFGLRYDITHFAAFKVEYRNLRRPGVPRIHGAFAQTSFTF
jgi:hypothetical protein